MLLNSKKCCICSKSRLTYATIRNEGQLTKLPKYQLECGHGYHINCQLLLSRNLHFNLDCRFCNNTYKHRLDEAMDQYQIQRQREEQQLHNPNEAINQYNQQQREAQQIAMDRYNQYNQYNQQQQQRERVLEMVAAMTRENRTNAQIVAMAHTHNRTIQNAQFVAMAHENRPIPIDEEKEKEIKMKRALKESRGETVNECCICFDDVDDHIGGKVILTCKHEFGFSCLRAYKGTNCPLCRMSFNC
jgi:K+/H+ antiporter YhaU regulatory subunit KhtT